MKYGLELESFISKDGVYIAAPKGMPMDGCGYLAEARGAPANNITDAVFLLQSEMYKMSKLANKLEVGLVREPLAMMPKEVLQFVRRTYTKGTEKFENLYGFTGHSNGKLATAGLHISFTSPVTITDKSGLDRVVNKMFDYVKLFRFLDNKFKAEISAAKRKPGFYEIKDDGRIEYRSLPNNINLYEVIDAISEFSKGVK